MPIKLDKMSNYAEKNRTDWDKRSQKFGADPKGVLFKSMPPVINEHVHKWHTKFVLDAISYKEKLSILDVGCGYGRMSTAIISKYPDADTIGIDISDHYVDLYKKVTSRNAFTCRAELIPPDMGKFDYIICVTVFMYIEDRNLVETMSNLLNLLNPKGTLIIIEPAAGQRIFLDMFGLAGFVNKLLRRKETNTRVRYFSDDTLLSTVVDSGGRVERICRLPVTTTFILALYVANMVLPLSIMSKLLNLCARLDKKLENTKLPSLFVGYNIRKNLP